MIPTSALWRARCVALFRVLRLARLLRSIRLSRHFKQLKLLIEGLFHSPQEIFWVMVLFLFILTAGIICTTIVGQHSYLWKTGPEDTDDEDEATIQRQFGALCSSTPTLFQMVALDDWTKNTRLAGQRMPMLDVFFIFYVWTADGRHDGPPGPSGPEGGGGGEPGGVQQHHCGPTGGLPQGGRKCRRGPHA